MAKEENFKSKLKNLFGIKERTNAASFHRPQTKELLFTPEILKVSYAHALYVVSHYSTISSSCNAIFMFILVDSKIFNLHFLILRI